MIQSLGKPQLKLDGMHLHFALIGAKGQVRDSFQAFGQKGYYF